MANLSKYSEVVLSLAKVEPNNRVQISNIVNKTSASLNLQTVVQAAYLKGEDGTPVEPNIQSMMKWERGKQDITTIINIIMTRFIRMNFDNDKVSIDEMVYDFTCNILETRKDFTLLDIVYFVKYIKENAGCRQEMKFMGKTLSDLKLAEMFNCYLVDRAIEFENYQRRISSQYKQNPEEKQKELTYHVALGDRYVIFLRDDKDPETLIIDYVSDKAEAAHMKLDSAYNVKKYLLAKQSDKSEAERKPVVVVLAKKRLSILEYIKKNIPDFFEKKPPFKSNYSVEFDEKRTKQMLQFLDASKELEEHQKEHLAREISENNRRSKKIMQERNGK